MQISKDHTSTTMWDDILKKMDKNAVKNSIVGF